MSCHAVGDRVEVVLKYIYNNLQSVTKIMGKTAIWAISCSYPLFPVNNVEKQRAKLAPNNVMGSQHCIGGEEDF